MDAWSRSGWGAMPLRGITPSMLLLPHVGAVGLGDDAPAFFQLEQGQVIGEVARVDGAFHLHESRLRTGEVDRHDAVGALEVPGLRRRSAVDEVEPLFARHVVDAAVAQAVEVAHLVKSLGQLARIALVESVKIGPHHLLNGLDVTGHGNPPCSLLQTVSRAASSAAN